MQQKLIKVISVLLVTMILYANSAAVISYAADNFLSDKEIENQGTSTQSKNVEFDVFYDGGKHTGTADINAEDTKLNIALNVKDAGYLKDAVVDLSDSNFTIAQTEESDNIQSFNAEEKKIVFNQINNGSNVLESINIALDRRTELGEELFKRDNTVRLTAVYVDSKAQEVKIDKEIVIHTRWTVEYINPILGYEITKYIPYVANGVSKLITQGKVTSFAQNNVLPIKETYIEIDAPIINEEYPEEVTVIANTTGATNGDLNGEKFTTDNWTYDSKTGKITIDVKNEPIDGEIKWEKDVVDEYLVTYIYSSDVYEAVKDTGVRIEYSANSVLTLYSDIITEITGKVTGYKGLAGTLGDIVEFGTDTTETLNKGYLYNNKNAVDENKNETEYTVKYTANISYSDIIDTLIFKQGIDQFVTGDEKEQPAHSYNKTLKISKKEFDRIFGEEGQIDILNSDGEILETINKDTVADKGNIVLDLSKFNADNVTIQTSNPVREGNLTLEITKAISKDLDYSTNQLKEFASLKTSMTGIAKNEDIDIANNEKINTITLEEPSQKVEVTTNNDRLSTIVKNENVEIEVTLENDSVDDIMYKNPTVRVDLPANIDVLDVKTAQLFFDDELKITKVFVANNEDGTKSIIANLEGTQTKHNNPAVKGATIVFTTDITLNKLTPTTDAVITATAINGDENNTIAVNETTIKYVAPTGVVTTNTMVGHNGEEVLEAINGEAKEAIIPTKAEQKEVTFSMNVINNYENTLDNVVVLGRTPFAGNKDVETSQDLGSTMDMPLTSGITVNGIDKENITIYYSENGEATTDLSDSSNGWKQDVTDYSKVKSYMIVLNDYTMNTGAMFTFSYKALIQANLDYEKSAYENYTVYFNNNKTSGTVKDKMTATKIGVNTGIVAKLDAKLTSKQGNGTEVKSGEKLEYELTINNTGSLNAENVTATIEIPTGLMYVSDQDDNNKVELETIEDEETGDITSRKILNIPIGTINAHSTVTKKIVFKIIESPEEREINVKAIVKCGDNLTIETETITNKILQTYFKIQGNPEPKADVVENNIYDYIVILTSSEDYDANGEDIIRKNTIVKVTLPEELKYESIRLLKYNEETKENENIASPEIVEVNGNVVTIKIGDLDGKRGKSLVLSTRAGVLPEGTYQKPVTIKATVQADGTNVENIPDDTTRINKPAIKVTQTCNIPDGSEISSAEGFTYSFTVENLSTVKLDDIKFVDYLPKGVQFKSLQVVYSKGLTSSTVKKNEDGSIETTLHLYENDKATVNVKVTAKSLETDTKITNKAKISHEWIPEIETNEISHIIEHFDSENIDIGKPGTGEQNKETKKIIGTIWVDENKDGVKDASEQKVSGVKVLLLNNKTGNLAVDIDKKECIATTGKDGAYMFNKVLPGKYSVIFLYDSSNYSPTTYKKEGVSEDQNSDAIDKTVIYEEKTQIAGVTEEIVVSDENRYNIDLGLVEDPKFDLSLEKEVKTITVNNSKTATEHVYNSKLAKIDFEAKYASSSSMVVEYKFTIKNEGGVPGYVKKLADYLPAELKFNSELNNEWYEGKDGVIYNNSLANTVINPGESKEVTLVLTKNMNSEDFGMITNSAEICETSNDYGLLDVDSSPGNRATNEDDYSTANVLTTVKTGGIIVYTTLTLTVITIIGVGIYMIKKRVLK